AEDRPLPRRAARLLRRGRAAPPALMWHAPRSMESFDFEYRLSCAPAAVFAELADPSYIARIAPFKVTVTHVRDGRGHRHGVGSIRRIKPWFGPPYEEQILAFEPDRLMEYTAGKGPPLAPHPGTHRTEPHGA